MLRDLIKMAGQLDSLGLSKEADTIDRMIAKIAVNYEHYKGSKYNHYILVSLNKRSEYSEVLYRQLFETMCQKITDFLSTLKSAKHVSSDESGYRSEDLITFPVVVRTAPTSGEKTGKMESYSCRLDGTPISGLDISDNNHYKMVWELTPPILDKSENEGEVQHNVRRILDGLTKYSEDLKSKSSNSVQLTEWLRKMDNWDVTHGTKQRS